MKSSTDKYGNEFWYNENNQLHRLDGPACIFNDGTEYWCRNGLYHRIGGPALEYLNGTKCWFLDGVEYSEEDYKVFVKEYMNPNVCSSFEPDNCNSKLINGEKCN